MTMTTNLTQLTANKLNALRYATACQVESHTSKLTPAEIARANRLVDEIDAELARRVR